MSYKHVANTDVAFMPYLIKETESGLSLTGLWLNIVNPANTYPMFSDDIFIKNQDLPNWREF